MQSTFFHNTPADWKLFSPPPPFYRVFAQNKISYFSIFVHTFSQTYATIIDVTPQYII